jgi:hypothetical protein
MKTRLFEHIGENQFRLIPEAVHDENYNAAKEELDQYFKTKKPHLLGHAIHRLKDRKKYPANDDLVQQACDTVRKDFQGKISTKVWDGEGYSFYHYTVSPDNTVTGYSTVGVTGQTI